MSKIDKLGSSKRLLMSQGFSSFWQASLVLPMGLMLFAAPVGATVEKFSVLIVGRNAGHLNVETKGGHVSIDYDYKDNGRGPTMAEALQLDANGLVKSWMITGTTAFGGKVDERFTQAGGQAVWIDSTGKGSATVKESGLYVAQNAGPWALGLYARALLKEDGRSLSVLPAGTLQLDRGEVITVNGKEGAISVTAYSLRGIDLQPSEFLLDQAGNFFAQISTNRIVVRAGYEGEDQRLRELAAKWDTDRYMAIEKAVAHRFDVPMRIKNIRVFDPNTLALSEPRVVVVNGKRIAAVEPVDSPVTPGEVIVDGAGGTLVAGMYEMHGHVWQGDALLTVAAGVTSVRDMGNENDVLAELVKSIESGRIGGPRVVRSGFIEGKSPFNATGGIVVDSEAAAIDAVRWYGARDYWQIKIYNSMNPAWVPTIVREAHRLGMRVAGHIPAFTNADAMIEAGYDEITHINQLMLGWVLKPDEDTRSLLRFTALKRFPALDLNSAKVQHTIGMMIDRKLAIDPTLAIHEEMTLGRDGQMTPGQVDYLDHMPVGYQRNAKQALAEISGPADDQAYRGAFETIVATLKLLNDRGVLIAPGTDNGGPFAYHRELELYRRFGMTPAQILKRATFDMAKYLGQDQQLGSIEKGKLADFFLIPGDPTSDIKAIKTISMVVKDGTVYFPAEIYPHFGIKPFLPAPNLNVPR